MNNENFICALNKTLQFEGGFTTGKYQIADQATNMGITQKTLDKYNSMYPETNFPKFVQNLRPEQAKIIYKKMYWDNTKIPDIQIMRIQNAVFDMNVMSGIKIATKTLQCALNQFLSLNLAVDGIIGTQTIHAINSIPEQNTESFINVLKSERLNSLQKMINWPTAHRGWTRRTMSY